MPPDLALLSTLTGSNFPCLELISSVDFINRNSGDTDFYVCTARVFFFIYDLHRGGGALFGYVGGQ